MALSTFLVRSENPDDGITGGYTGDSFAVRAVITSLTTLACYNAIELNILIFATFKRYHGLYFWSLLVASWGVVFYALGFLFKFFQIISNDYANVVLITVGWWAMITGQSFVLYSRLHLLSRNQRLLKSVLWMIILDVFILHFPTTVLTFGSNSRTDPGKFVHGYNVMEKIQMTGFCLQEFIISGIYLKECVKFLKIYEQEKSRRTLYELFCINMIIIVMDLSLLGIEYANLYILEIVIKGVVYSLKLKLEFALLGKLIQYAKPSGQLPQTADPLEGPEYANVSSFKTGVTQSPNLPIVELKSHWTKVADGKAEMDFEHLENRSSYAKGAKEPSESRSHALRAIRTESVPASRDEATGFDDNIEQMMTRYSVPREEG